ncbi:MAG TPA: aromatic ring-hydroxylating dioxygenase subunit alpha [Gemmatimonadales bacterium]|jgi:Rieske 2Fe-2S family protein|nr:aromatic ring-hydroxylating dioxygenase subunit alpha [Gemmatimonadales bacterium]
MTAFLKATEAYRQGQRTLPGEYYTSPEIYATELDRIFLRRWLCVGRAAELAGPGDFVQRSVAGESVIVVRGQDGVIRAFYNVCRHRGTRLCEAERGRLSETIQCPYHAWTYTLDGALIGAPHMSDVLGFDKRDYPLHPVAVDAWEGFLFMSLAREPDRFAEAFAPLRSRFSRFQLPRLRSARRIDYDVQANWKLVFQNFSECLHCPVIHPGLARLTPYTSGANDLVEGPYLGGYMLITQEGGSLTMSGRACGAPIGDLPAEDRNRVYFYSILPNMLLSLHPDYVMVHTLWPDGPRRTRMTCEWLFHPDAFGQPGFDPDDAVRFWDETNRQDWHICEQAQAGIASRAYQPGPYSPREGIAAAWDREFLRAIGHAAPSGAARGSTHRGERP